MILAWVAVFRYPRPCFTVRVVVLVVSGCGGGAERAPHLERYSRTVSDKKKKGVKMQEKCLGCWYTCIEVGPCLLF